MHVGQAHVAHGGEGPVVQLHNAQMRGHVHLRKGSELAVPGGVYQGHDLRLLPLQSLLIAAEGFVPGQVHGKGDNGCVHLLLQGQKPVLPPGDDPDLLGTEFPIHGPHKVPAHTGGCSGNHSDFFHSIGSS